MLTLSIIKAPVGHSNFEVEKTFDHNGGTIGRSKNCAWVLPDNTKSLSGNHAGIVCMQGEFCWVDSSTNGTFLQGGEKVTPTEAHPLKQGDVLVVGPYHIKVKAVSSLSSEDTFKAAGLDQLMSDGLQTTVSQFPLGHADSVESLDVFSQSARSNLTTVTSQADDMQATAQPFDFPGMHSAELSMREPEPEAYDHALSFLQEAPKHTQEAETVVERVSMPLHSKPEVAPQAQVQQPTQPRAQTADMQSFPVLHATANKPDDFFAFFCAHFNLDPKLFDSEDHKAMYQLICDTLEGLLEGVIKLTVARTKLKSKMRLNVTTIAPSRNNPLKLSVNPQQALEMLLRPQGSAFMTSSQAVQSAIGDLASHQSALFDALHSGLEGVLGEFAPQKIQAHATLPKGLDKAVFLQNFTAWQAYKTHYNALASNDGKALEKSFLTSYSEAYITSVHQCQGD
jgi:type VI secretion system FHA domain protein